MRLKLNLLGPDGSSRDIAVTADAVATVGSIADAIVRLDPLRLWGDGDASGHTLSVHHPGEHAPEILDADTHMSDARVGSGASVRIISRDEAVAVLGRGRTVVVVKVDSGPDAGSEFSLRRGSFVIGRDASADFVLSDPMVSKRHARVEVSDTVDMIDLNSANGIVVDGGETTRVHFEMSGQTALLGDSLLRVEFVEYLSEGEPEVRFGPVAFNRSPAVQRRYPGDELKGPEVPRELEDVPFPFLMMAAPLIMLGVIYFAFPTFRMMMIFLAMAPLMIIGGWLTQRIATRRRHKRAVEKFLNRLAKLDEDLAAEQETEREVRNSEAPGTEELVDAALELKPLLWSRRPEHISFLNVRLGIGTAPSRTTVKVSDRYDGIPEFQASLDEVAERYRLISDVAVIENLADAGCLGIAGDPVPASGAANALIAQISSLYSPTEVALAAIVAPQRSAEFDWIKWLPHVGSAQSLISSIHLADSAVSGATVLTALEEVIDARLAEQRGKRKPIRLGGVELEKSVMGGAPNFLEDPEDPVEAPCLVVLICNDAPLDRARVNAVIERAVKANILPIWVADEVADLPAACRTFVDLGARGDLGSHGEAPGCSVGYVRLGLTIEDVRVSMVGRERAEMFARSLSRVSDAAALAVDDSAIPRSISMVSLLGYEMSESAEAVIDRWRQNDSIHDRTPGASPVRRRAGRLRALVGQSSVDAMHLDLRSQGPHALVGGTTGSGKSEFLQAWVLGMAAEYSPDRVTFLFVDYKGGSAFAECVHLPHCVGLVTDLTPHLVRRALTSLRAELHYRERLLNRKKAKDLIELEKRGDPECPPALVLVIDEFAALVGEVPEFVDGIVDIAQRGRSLGIHLIMATQRPAGVIKDNLRANTNLRVALRVADAADSLDVVGSDIAAGFDPAIPGRAVAKSGPGRLVGFQTAYAGGWTRNEPPMPAVEVSDLRFGLTTPWQESGPQHDDELIQDGPNDTSRLVATMVAAAREAHLPEPRKPWLDELSSLYDSARLRQRTDSELVFGVVDDAKSQSQYPVYFRPDAEGHLAVIGAGGSGKSVALRTIATSAAITPRGGPVQVYALDFGSAGMRPLESLPHVGAVVDGDDTERVTRLLTMLRGLVEERAERFAAVRAGSIAEYRQLAGRPEEHRILLLIDGAGAFRQQFEYAAAGPYRDFQTILADGRSVGVHVVVSLDRPSSVPPAILSTMQRRVVLRLTDENDYSLLDAPTDVLSSTSPPGRAIVDGMEAQVAIFGGVDNVAEQSRAIDRLAATLRSRGVPDAPGVARLSDDIPFASLPPAPEGFAPIGVADDDLTPVAIEPHGAFMLSGPPSSGRSTALRMLALSSMGALGQARTFYLGNAKSRLASTVPFERVARTVDDVAALAREVTELAAQPSAPGNRILVVVEGLADFLSTPADAALIELFKTIKRGDHFVIAESETSTWSSSWPLLAEIKSARRGFAIQPDQQEGDLLFRTSFPRSRRSEFPPGRGYLVQAGKVRRVQLAHAAEENR